MQKCLQTLTQKPKCIHWQVECAFSTEGNSHEKHQCAHGLCAPVDVPVAYTVAISVCFAVQHEPLCKHASADSCSAVHVIAGHQHWTHHTRAEGYVCMNGGSSACSSICVSPFQLRISLRSPVTMLLVLAHLHASTTCYSTALLSAAQMHTSQNNSNDNKYMDCHSQSFCMRWSYRCCNQQGFSTMMHGNGQVPA